MDQEILKAINKFQSKLEEIDTKFINLEDNISNNINKNINDKFDKLNKDVESLRKDYEEQESRLDLIEKEIRTRNLILFGMAEEEKSYPDLENLLIEVVSGNLDINLNKSEIEFVRRIGKKGENSRPIAFAVTTLGTKIEILQNKNKLNGTNCYIKQDYPKKSTGNQKSLTTTSKRRG